jgi:hypothetical protein
LCEAGNTGEFLLDGVRERGCFGKAVGHLFGRDMQVWELPVGKAEVCVPSGSSVFQILVRDEVNSGCETLRLGPENCRFPGSMKMRLDSPVY